VRECKWRVEYANLYGPADLRTPCQDQNKILLKLPTAPVVPRIFAAIGISIARLIDRSCWGQLQWKERKVDARHVI
jgi:hypothetical protein